MTYDVHTHVGLDLAFYLRGFWPYAETAQALLGHMDAHGIDRAVAFPFVVSSAFDPYAFSAAGKLELLPGRVPYDRENQLLLREIEQRDDSGRLLFFAMFDPARCVEQQMANLMPIVARTNGLKTQTTVTQSPIAELLDNGRPFMELAEQHDLPVVIHTAVHPDDPWAQVADCIRVAKKYPRVRFNLAHSLRFHSGFLAEAASMPNVWVDCSAHLAHCALAREDSPAVARADERVDADYADPGQVLEAVYAILGDRYMWGTDNPFMSWSDGSIDLIFTYKAEVEVLRAVSPDVRTSMAGTAPEAWLGSAAVSRVK
ncbi:MAG: hypothetical protein EA426_09130 [Spirochaetaceae bacterium]|nr:MAG: hypothetical protein EA426_09130 [Spirochaetaceae bacterium]